MSFKTRTIFALLTVVGFIFFVFSVNAFQNINASKCPDIIRSGWITILTLSACVATAGMTFFFCGLKSTCDDVKNGHIFFFVFLLLAAVMILISFLMLGRYKKGVDCESEDSKNQTYLYVIIGMSIAIVIGCFVSIAIHFRK
jgi:hypothetical protein